MAATRSNSMSSSRSRGSGEKSSGSKANPNARGGKAHSARSRGGSESRGSSSSSKTSGRGSSTRTKARGTSSRSKSKSNVSGAGQATTDHEFIRQWVEERGGQPACVRGTGGKLDTGLLRIDMPGYTGEDKLAHIDWCDWFDKFEEKQLAFLYQDETAGGKKSNFNKLVNR